MKAFLQKTGLFLALLPLLLGLFVGAYFLLFSLSTADVPPPNLTDSYSYNEKLLFIKNHPRKVDCLAIGSSMCLDNLNSGVLTQQLKTGSFLNASSWGLSIKDDYHLLKILAAKHPIKTLIMVSSLVDFQATEKTINQSLIESYLNDDSHRLLYDVKTFSLEYFLTKAAYAKKVRSVAGGYETMRFDPCGGIALTIGRETSPARWNRDIFAPRIHPEQYTYLDSVTRFCAAKHIRLCVFQSPLRWGLLSKATAVEKQILAKHLQKANHTLNKPNIQVVNTDHVVWRDELFVDAIHLNERGAKQFTQYCLDQLQ